MIDYYNGCKVHYDFDGTKNNGYPYICDKFNKYARLNGVVDIHRIQASILLGRDLSDIEVVHHKDENKSNFDLSNLMVFRSASDHIAFHKGAVASYDAITGTFYCLKCNSENFCKICGNLINTKSTYCKTCKDILQYKVDRPPRSVLKTLIRTKSFLEVGRLYNVSDNAIRKWCKAYNLPFRTREIRSYTDIEWNDI